jgi:hypothetical protein
MEREKAVAIILRNEKGMTNVSAHPDVGISNVYFEV